MSRRNVLSASAGAVVATAAPASAGSAFAATEQRPDRARYREIPNGPLVNAERARRLMAQAGVDALVTLQMINTYYLTSLIAFYHKMGQEVPALAVFPRAPEKPVALIAGSAEIDHLTNRERPYPELLFPYTGASNTDDFISGKLGPMDEPDAWPAAISWQIQRENLTPREQRWVDAYATLKNPAAASPQWALARAIRAAGLDKAVLAVDDARIPQMLAASGLDQVRCVPGANLMRRIRMVKSPTEIAMMATAGRLNAEAANATIAQMVPGATMADIERTFAVEAAKRGMSAVFLLAGSLGRLPNEEVVEGRSILIDAVSHFEGYHGDYGRTFVIGEAPRELQPKAKLLEVAWEGAFEAIRPGVRYSQVQDAAREAARKSGLPYQLGVVNPHSVGLQHTDEPSREGLPFDAKDDLVLEEGMTITVDLPYIEHGWGSLHLEDLVLVTADGARPLHSMANPLIEM